MKNELLGILSFLVFGLLTFYFGICTASEFELDNQGEYEKEAVGVFLDTNSGVKVAVCLNDIVNCVIVYLPNSYSSSQIMLYKLKEPIPKYKEGSVNTDYKRLFVNSETIMR